MLNFKNFFQKIGNVKKIFSLDFFERFNWLVTILSFFAVLFLALFVWWQNLKFFSTKIPPEALNIENEQDFEKKDQQIKKIMEALEKRQAQIDNFPSDSWPREKVFKSEFVWEEENSPKEENWEKEKSQNNSSTEKISF
mgnify:CR=1 FL=1